MENIISNYRGCFILDADKIYLLPDQEILRYGTEILNNQPELLNSKYASLRIAFALARYYQIKSGEHFKGTVAKYLETITLSNINYSYLLDFDYFKPLLRDEEFDFPVPRDSIETDSLLKLLSLLRKFFSYSQQSHR